VFENYVADIEVGGKQVNIYRYYIKSWTFLLGHMYIPLFLELKGFVPIDGSEGT
jgi:hypothetical protein